ncbi:MULTISPECIES: sec-independent translocation TatB [Anaerolinea]|uniref:Sec-independent translocation TatB n=1 Tax=Anaerolinea thermophila (strain DSM 14523 / JCM 11388 / NBRC 100420 / UNI-1) TaxID=926569 RepID=E8N520_ANATU|nr:MULTISPECIES: sec-independent translocation TatB [Anaerolinea]BAJ63534.1 putative sec-independent translocation TatB [Anaerolinea thermophila UNI-1]
MQILNIGPLELIIIFLVMFILLGPEGMIKTARQIGLWIRKVVQSPIWREIMGYSQEIRELPTKIVRETGLEEDLEEIRKSTQLTAEEVENTVKEVNREINETVKEAGKVEVNLDLNPPAKSVPLNASTSSTHGKDGTSLPVPPVQTYDKYAQSSDEEEE